MSCRNSWVSHFNIPLSAEDLNKYYAIYEEFIIKGKADLLDYLGKKSEHPSWVSSGNGKNNESFSPALTVCNRNSSRGGLFDVLEEIGAIYYNEVWFQGKIMLYVGQFITLEGNIAKMLTSSHNLLIALQFLFGQVIRVTWTGFFSGE